MSPSKSTIGSAIGVPAALLIAWYANEFHGVTVPGHVEGALGALLGAVLGYIGDIVERFRPTVSKDNA